MGVIYNYRIIERKDKIWKSKSQSIRLALEVKR